VTFHFLTSAASLINYGYYNMSFKRSGCIAFRYTSHINEYNNQTTVSKPTK